MGVWESRCHALELPMPFVLSITTLKDIAYGTGGRAPDHSELNKCYKFSSSSYVYQLWPMLDRRCWHSLTGDRQRNSLIVTGGKF